MGKISLKVEIAGRTYPLTVLDSEEKIVLKAVEDINKAVALLKTNYAVSDSQDLLAMSSLQFMLKGASKKIEKEIEPIDYSSIERALQEFSEELDQLD
ncbi:MAG: cell division protein ZapA [Crocinitomicaceae bacterium]|jgi:cell division protein ZapA|nr:cell division protein ZapA [Crocinitomicaceae bacterium]